MSDTEHPKPSLVERPKMLLTLEDLAALAAVSLRNGTEEAFARVALEWAGKAHAELTRLQAERAALEADAARYRWLRGQFYEAVIPHGGELNGCRTAWIPKFVPRVRGSLSVDEAIDAARNSSADEEPK